MVTLALAKDTFPMSLAIMNNKVFFNVKSINYSIVFKFVF